MKELFSADDIPEIIDFNYHIKPILSDKCFTCHGPDANNRKGGLRLDIADSAYSDLPSGNGRAIDPGSLRNSQVYHRIVSKDAELVMPPPESNLKLNPKEIALISEWIKQKAEYKPHWAFIKPIKSKVPNAGENWANNEIDHFIAAAFETHNIVPSPESRREVLVRRLHFDLIGLPPSVNRVKDIMSNSDPDYYEKLVDSLMALPSYGERMAAHWLDVARFADSEGYLDDFHHEMWPYRDWVIKAFNDNLPYDKFILWQVGGDQIPGGTAEQRLATAFNRLHKQNSEGGAIAEEFRVEYVADRTNTLGTAFLGMTVACARCHDHKYDPISQQDYFELFSFFNSTIERGDAIFSLNAIYNGEDIPNELSMNAGPVMPLPNEEVKKIRAFLTKKIDVKASEIRKKANASEDLLDDWLSSKPTSNTLKNVVDNATVVHLNFDDPVNDIVKDLAPGSKTAKNYGQAFSPGIKGLSLHYQEGRLIADGNRVRFERIDPFTISFWIKTTKKIDEARVFYNGNSRLQGYRGWEVVFDRTRLSFRLNHAHPYQSLEVRLREELPLNQWQHFVWTYDGSGNAAGMKIYHNARLSDAEVLRNHLYRSTKPYTDPEPTIYMPYVGLVLGASHYDKNFNGGFLDEVRILDREAGHMVAQYLYDRTTGLALFEQERKKKSPQLMEFYSLHINEALKTDREMLRDLQEQELMAIDTVQEIMVMGDLENERPTYILERGIYDAPGEQVGKDVPENILPWPEELPRNRYGLGQWLIHKDNPLTARVMVNQFWYLIFGRGLVSTNEDFGNQGSLPSHPELLDWLAVDFMENGWDVKRLLKQMVTSTTYKQSSVVREDLVEIDPSNILLATGPRYRRSAEMVRDNILAASGLLNRKIGGKSAFPYQPEGLWRETISHSFFPGYEIDYENGLYRRSIYTFWKRNAPAPSMMIFDASNRSECQVKRQRSNTPLQALVLLNSPEIIEACRTLAKGILEKNEFDISKAIDDTFVALTSRRPTQIEQEILMRQYIEEKKSFNSEPEKALKFLKIETMERNPNLSLIEVASLARVTNTILNSTEAYYKN